MKRTVEITSVIYMTWMILYVTVKSGSVFMIQSSGMWCYIAELHDPEAEGTIVHPQLL
jgi:hypothetical protein